MSSFESDDIDYMKEQLDCRYAHVDSSLNIQLCHSFMIRFTLVCSRDNQEYTDDKDVDDDAIDLWIQS